jgi:hypothetical protein
MTINTTAYLISAYCKIWLIKTNAYVVTFPFIVYIGPKQISSISADWSGGQLNEFYLFRSY